VRVITATFIARGVSPGRIPRRGRSRQASQASIVVPLRHLAKPLYNRHVIRTPLLVAALLLAGCSKNIDTTDAVRLGVMDYLNALKIGLDVNNMQVDVTAVSFEKDHAHATVTITPKSTGGGGMQLAYDLDRKGDKWVVHGNAMTAGSSHGAPDSSDPTPGAPSGAQSGASQLPPGHPAVGTKQTTGTNP
jgi:hypothetical protein